MRRSWVRPSSTGLMDEESTFTIGGDGNGCSGGGGGVDAGFSAAEAAKPDQPNPSSICLAAVRLPGFIVLYLYFQSCPRFQAGKCWTD